MTKVVELVLAALVAAVVADELTEDVEEGAAPESSSWNLPLCARMPAWLVVDIKLIWYPSPSPDKELIVYEPSEVLMP